MHLFFLREHSFLQQEVIEVCLLIADKYVSVKASKTSAWNCHTDSAQMICRIMKCQQQCCMSHNTAAELYTNQINPWLECTNLQITKLSEQKISLNKYTLYNHNSFWTFLLHQAILFPLYSTRDMEWIQAISQCRLASLTELVTQL